MAHLVTTYGHDYAEADTNKQGFEHRIRTGPMAGLSDQCCGRKYWEPSKRKNCCMGGEWTRIGPMGPLITPRLIPNTPTEKDVRECLQDKPNQLLGKLCLKFPDFYDKLKSFPEDERYCKLETDRLNTTYQIDFGHRPLHSDDLNTASLSAKPFCSCYNQTENMCKRGNLGARAESDPCSKVHPPIRSPVIAAIPQGVPQSGFWPLKPYQVRFGKTEYQDKISRTGKSVKIQSGHDHSKCNRQLDC